MNERKLIFIRKGKEERELLRKLLKTYIFDIDIEVMRVGYKQAIENIKNSSYTLFKTANPCVLSEYDAKRRPLWWSEHTWKIYFIEQDKCHSIQEYTEKLLREAHDIEQIYLNDGFETKETT